MNKIISFICIALIIISILGCKENTQPFNCEYPFEIPESIKFIGHKGSGPLESNQNAIWVENGQTSILNALQKTDGTEVDIQMSKDSTLWLFHDHSIRNCWDTLVNFNSLNDNDIESINNCNYKGQLLNLEEFSGLVANDTFLEKIVSFDLKVLSNPFALEKWNVDTLLNYIFSTIDQSIDLNNIKLEVPSNINLEQSKSLTDHEVYQVHYDTSTIPDDIVNISMPFNLSRSYAKKNLQVWTPNKMSDVISALSSGPEIIQSDNISLISYFIDMRDGKSIECSRYESIGIEKSTEEFIELIGDTTLPTEHSFFHLKGSKNEFIQDQYLVLSVKDKNGKNLFYEAVNLWENPAYLFLNFDSNCIEGCLYSIYIWNKVKSTLNVKGELIQYK